MKVNQLIQSVHYFAEYVLHELPFMILLFMGGMILDHYLNKYFELLSDKGKRYNRATIGATTLEIIVQMFLLAIMITWVRKTMTWFVMNQTIFSQKGRFVFNPKGRISTQLMHAFFLFFTQINLKKRVKNLYNRLSGYLLK